MNAGRDPPGRLHVARAALLLLVALAVWRVTVSWRQYSHTFDEPAHLAVGMEYLSRGTYTYELHHPPLARVAIALGPYLAGSRTVGAYNMFGEGTILLENARYRRTLTLARAGVLPFFLLLLAVCWTCARRLSSDPAAAVITVGVVTAVPLVLAHAGLATTDIPGTAFLVTTFWAFARCLERPSSASRALLFGVAGGAAICTKFSAIPYFVVGGAGMVVLAAVAAWRNGARWPSWRWWWGVSRAGALAGASALLVILAVYRFQFGPIRGVTIPAPDLIMGLYEVVLHNRAGHESYLFGQTYNHGHWMFFPVGIVLKSPIAFLLLAGLATWIAIRAWRHERSAWLLMPLVPAVGLVAVAMSSNINIGMRHLLPLYPLAAIAIGPSVVVAWRAWPRVRVLLVALLAWLAIESASAGTDPLPWFNTLAGREPGRVLVDSDLDWGQDTDRLAAAIRADGRISPDSLDVLVFAGGVHAVRLLPGARELMPGELPTRRFVAISETYLRRGAPAWTAPRGDPTRRPIAQPYRYRWLLARPLVLEGGKTIRVYDLRAGGSP